jgi:hypothetical protein
MKSQFLLRCGHVALYLFGAAVVLACGADAPTSPNRLSPAQGGAAVTDFGGDLPCDVATLLLQHCAACHGTERPLPPRLAHHADLVAAASQPGMTVADAALASMRGALTPMPPAGLLSEAEVAPLAAWIDAGMPSGTCEGLVPPPGAELVCSSDAYRSGGDDGDEDMFPGRACNGCHRGEGGEDEEEEDDEAPLFAFAGTVYPTVREPDDCIGTAGAVVTLRDSADRIWQLTTRAGSGNFMLRWPPEGIVFPVTASVTHGDLTLEMMRPIGSADEGDCNGCHTQDGANGALGRIFDP